MQRFSSGDRPRLGLVVLAVLLLVDALWFPLTGAAGLALLLLVALAGAMLARASAHPRFELPRWAPAVVVALSTVIAAIGLFAGPWDTPGWRPFDWGPHHANLRHLIDGLRHGHIPVWVQSVSTGDSPYELYPFLPYYLAAKAAIWTHAQDLTLVLVRTAIIGHTLAALGAALLAVRIVRWPWAAAIGFATLYDVGSVWGGGADGLLGLGVLHSALANAIWPFVLLAVLSALESPRWWKSASIWLLVAFGISMHPLGLVNALATGGALLLVALLARDVGPHRALAAFVHVGLGVLLVAFVWMPLNERLLLYGVHYALPAMLSWGGLQHVFAQPIPEATIAPLVYAGYCGILVGAWSRRAGPTLLGCFAGILMASLFDHLWVLLHGAPSLETARFQTVRLASAAKISLYICGAYLLQTAFAAVRPQRSHRADRTWLVMGALAALTAFGLLRSAVPYFDRLGSDLRGLTNRRVPDTEGLKALSNWAREQNQAMRPERFGRLLHQSDYNVYDIYHVNAESGLPTLWMGIVPDLFLRERMTSASVESLRRFNVRWVMRRDEPPAIGDPRTERRFGRYIVRELSEWDGLFARVERGSGNAVVKRLDDERIDVELLDTTKPALVVLGMGYYPRWQARHEQRGALPVYAAPATPGGKLDVVAAWLPPGRTTFTATGKLPSDGKGWLISALAALVALGITILGVASPDTKLKIQTSASLLLARLKKDRRPLAVIAVATLLLVLFGASFLSLRKTAESLRVGSGLVAAAEVEAREPGTRWETCTYLGFYGAYRCMGPVLVQDAVVSLLDDAPPSPPFVVPAIHVAVSGNATEVRVRLKARLEGEYWAETNGGDVTLAVSGEPDTRLSAQQTRHLFPPSPEERSITLLATVPQNQPLQIAFVRRDRIEPVRNYPLAPENCPY